MVKRSDTRSAVGLPIFLSEGCRFNIQQLTCTEKHFFNKTISKEILSEQLKPVALDNGQFENRQNIKIIWILLHFAPIKSPIYGKKEIFFTKSLMQKFSIVDPVHDG